MSYVHPDASIHPSARVHPSAIIEAGARLAAGVTIGAYAYIGGEADIGEDCEVCHHATVEGYVILGRANKIFPYALIGGITHDLKFKGGRPGLLIGDNNEFREYSTVHPATNDGDFTRIGNNNHLLAYAHIAHDCALGNNIVMSGHNALAGHVTVGDHALIAWGCGVHQFCRIGTHAMTGAMSKTVKDIPPYMIAEGDPATIRSVNKVGLERNGFAHDAILRTGRLHRILYRDGLNRTQALEKIRATPELAQTPEALALLAFHENTKRGVA
ncbi:MAG: acyl-ACP--UDP-N-acetylglucosamine O-acyltransferase [Puniceicoccales bacterium]|jgi:UDP-N-acetylglucosamine acyltransferase|nr:acyl-ACP--UDP-N-acetylglucosamine O-acyltransferase [Puniceicoccales bacterium]